MRSTRLAASPFHAVVLGATALACRAPGAPVTPSMRAPSADASASRSAPPTSEGEPRLPRAHWVPRLAASPWATSRMRPTPLGGPMTNNYGSLSTVLLRDGRIGLIEHGRRWIASGGRAEPLDRDASLGIEAVVGIDDVMGGGFLFWTKTSLSIADTFDGTLRPLTKGPDATFEVGPGVVLVSERGATAVPRLVMTKTGAPVKGAPRELNRLFAHTRGFGVGAGGATHGAWFTTDGRAWRPLPLSEIQSAVEDGDALLVSAKEGRFHVGKDGTARPANLSDEEATAREIAFHARSLAAPVGPRPPSEATLLDSTWAPTGRHEDEWFILDSGQLWVTRTARGEMAKVGPRGEGDSCAAATVGGRPIVMCFELGKRLRVEQLDLSSGARTLEREIVVTKGVSSHIGTAQGIHPETLFVAATCEGDAEAGYCVRDDKGHWRTFTKPPITKGLLLPFPGEMFFSSEAPDKAVILQGPSFERRFDAKEMERAQAAMGIDPAAPPFDSPVARSGVLRTATGVRFFHGPSPFKQVAASNARSFVLDVPIDPDARLEVKEVSGVIATAGLRALRLHDGKLYETNDGWETWYEVAGPPTGVPADLDGAMCDDRGCRLRAWSRIGWERRARAARP